MDGYRRSVGGGAPALRACGCDQTDLAIANKRAINWPVCDCEIRLIATRAKRVAIARSESGALAFLFSRSLLLLFIPKTSVFKDKQPA